MGSVCKRNQNSFNSRVGFGDNRSITVNISRYYYEMSQQFGSRGHDKFVLLLEQSSLIGQFKQVAVVYENLDDVFQIAQMVL